MKDELLNLKLKNIALIAFIVLVGYITSPVWWNFLSKFGSIIFPFLLAFAVAYALYPFLKKLEKKGIPKPISVAIIVAILIIFLGTMLYLLVPLIYNQSIDLINITIDWIKNFSIEQNIDLSLFQEKISDIGSIISNFGNDISNFGINLLSSGINFIVMFVIVSIVSVYLLYEMENIRSWIKKMLKRSKRRRNFLYVKELDTEISNYFEGLELFMLIQFFEYTIAYLLIGHPYFILMGILAAVTTVIPYFGGIFANIVAILTAALVSPKLLVLTIILAFILPNIDGYIISPRVYSKSNNMHPLVIIFSVFAGGILAGFVGILIALPLSIILICTYRFYEKEIKEKIKERNKED